MIRNARIGVLAALIAVSGLQAQVSISGTVRDKGNKPLAGVTVQLKNENLSAVTDANGYYQLGDASVAGDYINHQANCAPVLSGGGLMFTLDAPERVRVTVSDPAGHAVRVCDKAFTPGTYRLPLAQEKHASGIMLVSFRAGKEQHLFRYIHGAGITAGSERKAQGFKASAVSDTLVFTYWSFKTHRIPLSSLTGTHNTSLESMGDTRATTVSTRTYEHEGVTFTFDAARQVGHFVRGHSGKGDLFVVGATKLKYQNEFTTLASGRQVNGAMLNIGTYKEGTPTGSSGFTSTSTTGANYDASLNVMANADKEVSLVPGDMLVVSQSHLDHPLSGKANDVTDRFIVVACVADVPYWDEFRPPYMWPAGSLTQRPRFRLTDVDLGKLPSLSSAAVPVAVPDPAALAERHRWPAIDYAATYSRDWLNPVKGQSTYGRDLTNGNEPPLAYLLSDQPLAEKRKVATGYIQHGIDRYGAQKEAVSRGLKIWPCDGGHNNGRMFQIMISGHLLGHDEMKNIRTVRSDFQEVVMTVYVTQDLVNLTQAGISTDGWQPAYKDNGYQPYEQGMAGQYPMPEWRGKYKWETMNYRWSHPYRFVGNMSQHYADVLAVLSMGLRSTLDHDAFIDCKIRHWRMRYGYGDPWRFQGGSTPLYSAVANADTDLDRTYHAWLFLRHIFTYYSYPWE